MNVRIINTDEIKVLFQLFDYNDPDEMIAENTRDINKEKIDIFGLFQDGNLIGENHIPYVHSNERFAVTIKKMMLTVIPGFFTQASDSIKFPNGITKNMI